MRKGRKQPKQNGPNKLRKTIASETSAAETPLEARDAAQYGERPPQWFKRKEHFIDWARLGPSMGKGGFLNSESIERLLGPIADEILHALHSLDDRFFQDLAKAIRYYKKKRQLFDEARWMLAMLKATLEAGTVRQLTFAEACKVWPRWKHNERQIRRFAKQVGYQFKPDKPGPKHR